MVSVVKEILRPSFLWSSLPDKSRTGTVKQNDRGMEKLLRWLLLMDGVA